MSESNSPNFVPKWKQRMNAFVNAMNALDRQVQQLPLNVRRIGVVLLLIFVIVLMSGCNPFVREECPPYPELPPNLRNHTSKNLDLVPKEWLLPPLNVSPDLTPPSPMPLGSK